MKTDVVKRLLGFYPEGVTQAAAAPARGTTATSGVFAKLAASKSKQMEDTIEKQTNAVGEDHLKALAQAEEGMGFEAGNGKRARFGVMQFFKVVTSFTGGLWMLFHVLSVQVEKEMVEREVEKGMEKGDKGGNKEDVRDEFYKRLRSYIANYFGCDHCRKEFLEVFDACGLRRCRPGYRSDIWLWDQHNRVTQRVDLERQGKGLVDGVDQGGDSSSSSSHSSSSSKELYDPDSKWVEPKSAFNGKTALLKAPSQLLSRHLNGFLLWPGRPDCPKCYADNVFVDERHAEKLNPALLEKLTDRDEDGLLTEVVFDPVQVQRYLEKSFSAGMGVGVEAVPMDFTEYYGQSDSSKDTDTSMEEQSWASWLLGWSYDGIDSENRGRGQQKRREEREKSRKSRKREKNTKHKLVCTGIRVKFPYSRAYPQRNNNRMLRSHRQAASVLENVLEKISP